MEPRLTKSAITTSGIYRLEREVLLVYQEQSAGLLRFATSLSRSPDLARDAVQEAFLRFFVERVTVARSRALAPGSIA